MTVLSSETRLIGTGAAVLPRVNLLPPEIAEKRAFRRVQMGLGTAVLGAIVLVGLGYVSATNGVSSAQDDLSTAQARNASLQVEAAKFKNVTAVYDAAAAAQAQLATAMGDEVRYSQLLNDLSLVIPSNVWLKQVALSSTAPATPATGTTTVAAAAAASAAPSGVGTFTVTGVGFDHDDVAVWLEAVSGLKTYSNAYFANSTEALLGTKPIVNFTSSATVTSKALSGRYTKPAGG